MQSLPIVVGDDPHRQLGPYSNFFPSDPHKVNLEPEEVRKMSEHFGLDPGDLDALC